MSPVKLNWVLLLCIFKAVGQSLGKYFDQQERNLSLVGRGFDVTIHWHAF